jgi:hypothetical protein
VLSGNGHEVARAFRTANQLAVAMNCTSPEVAEADLAGFDEDVKKSG